MQYPHLRIAERLYFVGGSPTFVLPPKMLTTQGAHRYGAAHPFVGALAEGPQALRAFYARFSPADLAEMYRIPKAGMAGEQLAPWELPWLLRKRVPPGEEVGLGLEHGVSYYGPCTEEKIAAEHLRLTTLVQQISDQGYKPEIHGHIEGHFLRSRDNFVFFVRGGKHRAAVLTYLGYKRIPVKVRASWPRAIVAGTERDWPLVASREVDAGFAAKILDRYFDDDE